MGCHPNIDATTFPKQGDWLGKRCDVVFHYDTSRMFPATVIREDAEEPGIMILQLDDGRVVLSTECMYSFPKAVNHG